MKVHDLRLKKIIVVLSSYFFPCSHPVLENVFAKELGRDFEIIFLFKGDISKGRKQQWHNTQVVLSLSRLRLSWLSKLNKLFEWQLFINLLKLLFTGEIKIVIIIN